MVLVNSLGIDTKRAQDIICAYHSKLECYFAHLITTRYADELETDEVCFSDYVYVVLSILALRVLYSMADVNKTGELSKAEIKKILVSILLWFYFLTFNIKT